MWLGVVPRTDTKKICFQKRLDCVLKYDNHSRLNSQHIWKGCTWHYKHKNMYDSINLTTCSFCSGAYHGFEASPIVHKNLSSRAHHGELLDTIFKSKQKLSNAVDTIIQMRAVRQHVHQLHPSIRLSDWAGSCSVVLTSHTQKSHQHSEKKSNNQIMNMYTLIQISCG